jgi:hypothetical protein
METLIAVAKIKTTNQVAEQEAQETKLIVLLRTLKASGGEGSSQKISFSYNLFFFR